MQTTAQIRAQFSREIILQAATELLEEQVVKLTCVGTPGIVKDFLRLRLGPEKREHFAVIFLNTQLRFLAFEIMFSGTINQTSVHPREIARRSLELGAAAIILVHNHPSNETDPSFADKAITKKIQQTCEIVDVRVMDHLVVGLTEITSFSEKGLL